MLHGTGGLPAWLCGPSGAQICYAMKANSKLAVLQTFVQAGCGLDMVSGGELERALRSQEAIRPKSSSPAWAKPAPRCASALQAGIGCFNIESLPELDVLSTTLPTNMGLRAPVGLHVNPNVDAKPTPTFPPDYKGNKFGIAHDRRTGRPTSHAASALPGLHVKSASTATSAPRSPRPGSLFGRHEEAYAGFVTSNRGRRHPAWNTSTLAAVWASTYHRRAPHPPPMHCGSSCWPRVDARGLMANASSMIEPGRSLVGNAGICLTEVLYRQGPAKRPELPASSMPP